ncbi:hypothetical protein M7I_6934 [Glarea lozoyensis 74030]|uniref:Phosphatidate cytidylyltransferase, mitochondrial n=1 Tax=Glarea lozoyensis (strain ATCC 74030 / MF5533) TaxID=1104152 RepID=H0EVX7_GLAL7|nr:hypothetical protein M7I_6934 [Glarea lozoyensis 74030]
MGDPRMALPTEDKSKVANIVGNNLPNFRRLPDWALDPTLNARLTQDMSPIKRGNMVRRLPKFFRSKLYFQYQKKYQIPQLEFNKMLEASSDESGTRINRREGGGFEQRIASEPPEELRGEIRGVIKSTVSWPSTSQSLKGPVTAGAARTWRYMKEKVEKYREGKEKDRIKKLEKESEKKD